MIDSATFKDIEEVEEVRSEPRIRSSSTSSSRTTWASPPTIGPHGHRSGGGGRRGSAEVGREFPRSMFFAGKLVFEEEHWYQRVLHNETAYQLQRRLQFAGLNAMVLPVRVLAPLPAA